VERAAREDGRDVVRVREVRPASAVARVAEQRMPDVRGVDADLVRAARLGEEPDERRVARGERLLDAPARARRDAAVIDGVDGPRLLDGEDRSVDRALRRRGDAVDDREVLLLHVARLELLRDVPPSTCC